MDDDRVSPVSLSLALVMGVAGVGKSTIASHILRRFWFVYLDNNFIADAFYRDTRMDEQYVRLRPRLYDVLYRVTEENLRVGNSVLLDVSHVTHMQGESWRSFVQSMCSRLRAQLVVLRCYCSEETLRRRLRERGEKRDLWKLDNWSAFLQREPLDVEIPFPHLDINTDQPIDECVQKAIAYIRERCTLDAKSGT